VVFNTLTEPKKLHVFTEISMFWKLYRLFQCSEAEKRIRAGTKVMDDFANTIINSKRRDAKDGNMGPDLISRFLEESQEKNELIGNKEVSPFFSIQFATLQPDMPGQGKKERERVCV
jgi:hypothetical protein